MKTPESKEENMPSVQTEELTENSENSETKLTEEPVMEQPPKTTEQPTATAEDITILIDEAEERGYLRGRNEIIEQMMQEPPLFSNPVRRGINSRPRSTHEETDASKEFLSNIRPQVWD